MTRVELTEEQRLAVERRDGSLLVRAGAGTGKTSVLVERFVQAAVADGVPVDAILAITFTEKAAAQLAQRVRKRLREMGERALAREAERAWISTIHGFCSRVLRAHAIAAGIDPEYRVLDELEAERVAIDAFDRALADFLADDGDPKRLELVAAYTPDRLAAMVRTVHSQRRSKGERRPSLPPAELPEPAGELEAYRQAVAAALRELGGADNSGVRVSEALDKLGHCGDTLGRLDDESSADPGELDRFKVGKGAKALSTPVFEELEERRAAYLTLCLRRREYQHHVLLRDLLELYGDHYEALKRDRSGLDFEDLELLARDLLQNPTIQERYAGRFQHVLVDEYQDTNPLQNEILGLLERDNLFRVGDEHQSIYGFRHAEVSVFRRHADQAAARGRAEKLTANFRSRGEVLDAIDMAFGSQEVWGDSYEPLREAPGSREPAARVEPSVELLVTDQQKGRWDDWAGDDEDPFGAALHGVPPWRAAEARLLARRIEELIRAGYKAGDVVILLRATTHMAAYDQALQERGVPTYVVGGRGYFSQQQVADLRAYLGALANPLDALAMYSVLASPLVGVSLDGVALIALRARTRAGDVWRTITDGDLDGLPAGDAERITAFAERFEAERAGARRVSLETLIDRAVTESGYDRHVLRMPAGDRRMANVRKLMRMAREYEAEEGRDLRGFIDFVAERDLVQEREGEAPLEAEDVDAVRLMTIHRAKGLEFPVVCVADLGKVGREDTGSIRLTDDGRMGLRLAEISGGSVNSVELDRIKREQKEADEEEEKRILYVAMTRAEEHLVLSGATDLEKLPPMKPLEEPMRWVWRAFEDGEFEGRPVRVRRVDLSPGVVDEMLPEADRRPEPPPPAAASEIVPDTLFPPELAAVPAPEPLRVSRLSSSSLGDYARCGYRFYLERALRLPGPDRIEAAFEGEGLPPLLRGTIVHELLERLDFRRPAVPRANAITAAVERHGATATDADVEDLAGMVEGFVGSPLRERIARAGRARSELPFAFTLDSARGGRSLLVNGVVDVLAEEDAGVLVVDYKSDRLEGAEPESLFGEQYEVQRIVYALAALRGGAEQVNVVHVFLECPGDPLSAVFERADEQRLERDLRALAAGVAGGRFVPTAEPHAALCADCPGQPALCSWPPERTLAE